MKLQHYLGGLEGLPEPLRGRELEKRVFVEDWEKRIFGIHVAMMGLSNHLGAALPEYPIDEVPTAFKDEWTWADLRTGAEAMNPFDYFKFRYYEKWLGGITQFFIDKGYVTEEELAATVEPNSPRRRAPRGCAPAIDDQVIAYLRDRRQPPPRRRAPEVRGRARRCASPMSPADAHSRLPGYLRGPGRHRGARLRGRLRLLLHTGDGIGDPMPIYIVEFDPAEIWGPRAEDGPQKLYAELFEAYLAPVEENRHDRPVRLPARPRGGQRQQGGGAGVAAHREGRHHAADRRQGARLLRDRDDAAQRQEDRRQGLDRPGIRREVVVDDPRGDRRTRPARRHGRRRGRAPAGGGQRPGVHNLMICTLCSCFPWPVLGLPPYWYKDPDFRSRAAREPRKVLAEVGVDLPADTEIKVWDSSGTRGGSSFPNAPPGPKISPTEMLMDLVTTEAMIGVALAGPAS